MGHRTSIDPLRVAAPLAAALALALTAPAALADPDPVGRALVARGGVTVDRDGESARGLGRGDPVYEGDLIRTGARGRVQLRLQDEGLVDLEPSSRFEIETYAGDEGDGNVVMRFLRGAMRTITGAIGGDDGESYEVQTSVATIGVRGTAYALRYCDAACVDEGGDPGIYGRVDEGEITATGPGGRFVFGAGDYFFLPESGNPRRIVVPPDGVLDGGDDGNGGGGPDGTEDAPIEPLVSDSDEGEAFEGRGEGLDEPEYNAGEDTELEEPMDDEPAPRPGTTDNVLFAGGFVAGEDGDAREGSIFVSPGEGDVRLDADAVVGAEFPNAGFVDPSEGSLNTGSTTLGFSSDQFEIEWGWWTGPLRLESGAEEDASGAFVYAYTDPANITPTAELNTLNANTVTFGYGNAAGGQIFGPGGFDGGGGSWSVTNFGVLADFGDETVDLAGFDITDFSTTIDLTGGNTTGSLDLSESTIAMTGLSDSDGTYTGEMRGVIVGPNANGMIIRFDITGDDEITGVLIAEPGT